jgi:uncharacterized protein with ParB-like and HNH nuclease domain
VTVPIKEYRKLPVFILKIKEICEKHNEKYQMFCKSHGCPCCRNCTIENHKECKDVIIIEDIIQDAKKSVSFDDVRQTKLSFQADDQKLNLLNNVNRFGKIIIERMCFSQISLMFKMRTGNFLYSLIGTVTWCLVDLDAPWLVLSTI